MDVPGFACLLKQKNTDSEIWWDASPTLYESFKNTLRIQYPGSGKFIESVLPDAFSPSRAGISGATTNPRLISQAVIERPLQWHERIERLAEDVDAGEHVRQVYDQVITEGAKALHPLWVSSHGRCGWLSAQIEGGEGMSDIELLARGLQLAALAPNVMVKVPGSEQGYRVIEQLVARGCSVNNTFCFSVSQVAACLKAVHNGRLQAQVLGVSTERARYVVSFMMGRLGAETAFEAQADARNLTLTLRDRRWAELAVYQAIQALMRRWQTPVRLLLCSLKIDVDTQQREHCWHLERTGAETTLYTLTPQIIELLIRRHEQGHPITPANDWVQVPRRVLNRLLAIPYFNQAYFEGHQAPAEFAVHPAFIKASQDAYEGQRRLSAFVSSVRGQKGAFPVRHTRPRLMERVS